MYSSLWHLIDSFVHNSVAFTTEGHGQTVVLPKPRENSERLFSKLSAIDELTYVDVLLLKDNLLKPVPFERILEQISYLPRVTYRSLLGQ